MEEYIREGERVKKNSDVIAKGKQMEKNSPGNSKDEFRRIQMKFATILKKDVIDHAGIFSGGAPTGPEEIKARLRKQGLDADGHLSLADPSKKYVNDPYADM